MKQNRRSEIRNRKSEANALSWIVAVVALFCWEQSAVSQTTNAPTKLSYDSFRTVSDRNIFNPNRYVRGSSRSTTKTASVPASRVESFSLVGIMAYEKGWFAFFDGTKNDYRQTLQVNGEIGEYKVVRVTPEAVSLAAGTNSFDLKVGMQMRREDEGDWFLSAGGESARKRIVSTRTRTRGGSQGDSPSGGGGVEPMNGSEPEMIVIESGTLGEEANAEQPTVSGNGNDEAASGGEADPVLLRLMQRRQQMNQ